MKIGLLSTFHAGFLGYFIQEIVNMDLSLEAIIIDSKEISGKDSKILEERTGGRLPPIPLADFEEKKIPFYIVSNHNSPGCVELVKQLGIDVLVNAGTPRILKKNILNAPRVGILNIHPGLLPEFRGCTSVEWAIYFNKQIGNTAHFMAEGIDEGPIIMKDGLTFNKDDKYIDIRVKVYREGFKLCAKALKKINDHNLCPGKMEKQGKGTYRRVIDVDKMQKVMDIINKGEYAWKI